MTSKRPSDGDFRRGAFRRNFGPRELHKAFCTECGKEALLPFRPTEGHPVYCRDCYQKRPAPSHRFDRDQEPPTSSAPEFEFAGVVGPDGRPIEPSAEIPQPMRLAVCEINDDLIEYLREHPEQMYELPSRKFEFLIAELLARRGFDVEVTPATRDGGFDMYAAKNDALGRFLFLVECKRYRADRKIGVVPVRSLYGVVQEKKATAGIIATTSFFTTGAKAFQNTVCHQLKLHDYIEVQRWLARV